MLQSGQETYGYQKCNGVVRDCSKNVINNTIYLTIVDDSNFKFGTQLGFRRWQVHVKTQLYNKNWHESGLGRDEPPKFLDHLFISVTAEASKFRVGIQLAFRQ